MNFDVFFPSVLRQVRSYLRLQQARGQVDVYYPEKPRQCLTSFCAENLEWSCLECGKPFRALHGVDFIEQIAQLGILFWVLNPLGRLWSENAHSTDAGKRPRRLHHVRPRLPHLPLLPLNLLQWIPGHPLHRNLSLAYDEKSSILNIDHNENYYPEPDHC